MSQVFGGDFEKVANPCTEALLSSHSVCFKSMGRDIGGNARNEPRRAIALCGHVIDPNNRLDCLEGAVHDTSWDGSGAELALGFCDVLIDPKERERCYTTIIARAPQIIQDSEDLVEFCNRVAPEFRPYCMAGAR